MTKARVLTELDVERMLAQRINQVGHQILDASRDVAERAAERHSERMLRQYAEVYGMPRGMARPPRGNDWINEPARIQINNAASWSITQQEISLSGLQRAAGLLGGGWDLASGTDRTAVATQVQAPVAVIDMPSMGDISTVPIEVPLESLNDVRNHLAMEAESVLGYTKIREKVKAPSQLRCVLAKLEIEVLNAEEVQKYKLQACGHMKTARKLSDPRWAVTPLKDYKGEIPEFVISKAVEVKKELPAAQFFVEHLQEDPFLLVSTLPPSSVHTGWTGNLGGLAVTQPEDVMYLEVWNEKSFEARV